MKERLYIHFLMTFLIVMTCAAQKNAQKLTIKDSCKCNIDTSFANRILYANLKNTKLIVLGIGNTSNDNPWSEIYNKLWDGIKIINCSNCKVLKEIVRGHYSDSYEVEVVNDTLFLNYYFLPVDKKAFMLYQIFFTNENDSITTKYRISKGFKFADKNELLSLRKKYTSITRDSIMKEDKTFSSQKNIDLSFKRLDLFGWQLLYAAISGDNEAKDRLLNFQKYYDFIGGAYQEEFYYPGLYNELKEFHLIENK